MHVHVADAGGSTTDATSYLIAYEPANHGGGSFVIGDLLHGGGRDWSPE